MDAQLEERITDDMMDASVDDFGSFDLSWPSPVVGEGETPYALPAAAVVAGAAVFVAACVVVVVRKIISG